jgi:hypothetical protein
MTAKTIQNGKISVDYDLNGNDNRYSLWNTPYKDIFQCGVAFIRQGDNNFESVLLKDWKKTRVQMTTKFPISTVGTNYTLQGLPNNLTITRTGNFGTSFDFVYAASDNVNYFAWNSETTGDGKGPWTLDPNPQPKRLCKVIRTAANAEFTECWFPCYRTADGNPQSPIMYVTLA